MDIVIIANFCAALDKPTNSRFDYIANLFAKENDVEMIGSTFSHDTKKRRECDFSRFLYKVTLVEEPGYKKNISIQRFLSHKVWGENVLNYIKRRKKPDVVYCAIPSLTAAEKVGRYCNQNGVRFIVDIQDLWPEAFQMAVNIPVISNIAFIPFKIIANKAYSAADAIIAVSQTYVDRARLINSKAQKYEPVYIGTNLAKFDKNVECNRLVREDNEEFWVGYCGSLSDSYDIPCVIDAIKLLDDCNVKLVVVGSGYLEQEFKRYAQQAGINACFMGYVSYPQMCGVLSACDIAVNPIKGNSAASIINKHADYASAGLPVINTQDSEEYRNLVVEYHMGINCRNGDVHSVSSAIEFLINNAEKRVKMSRNARKCAEERFDRENSYKKIIDCLSD